MRWMMIVEFVMQKAKTGTGLSMDEWRKDRSGTDLSKYESGLVRMDQTETRKARWISGIFLYERW